ncbi:MAG TPA: hypothetical protein VK961_28680, partial [Chthoniobacter sp.]|nr:hypothetical protein [Chthoniobacter sp.]
MHWPKLSHLARRTMPLFLSLLALAAIPILAASNIDEEALQREKKRLLELDRTRTKFAQQEGELRAQLEKAVPGSKQADALAKKLAEAQGMLRHVDELKPKVQAKIDEVVALKRLLENIGNDSRRPTEADISGSWKSDSIGVGYVIQIEQQGELIKGRGYYWSSPGTLSSPFSITGSYKDGLLSLAFDGGKYPEQKRFFRYAEEQGRPQFEDPKSDHREHIV